MRNSQGQVMHDSQTPAGGGNVYAGSGLPPIKGMQPLTPQFRARTAALRPVIQSHEQPVCSCPLYNDAGAHTSCAQRFMAQQHSHAVESYASLCAAVTTALLHSNHRFPSTFVIHCCDVHSCAEEAATGSPAPAPSVQPPRCPHKRQSFHRRKFAAPKTPSTPGTSPAVTHTGVKRSASAAPSDDAVAAASKRVKLEVAPGLHAGPPKPTPMLNPTASLQFCCKG